MVYLFITRVRVNHSYSMDNQFLVSPDSFLASLGRRRPRSIAPPFGSGGITTPTAAIGSTSVSDTDRHQCPSQSAKTIG